MDIDNLKDLMKRVTPGPWVWCADPYGGHRLISWVPGETFPNGSPRYMKVHDDGSAGGEYSPSIDVPGEDADLIAMAPDLADEVIRLTEYAQSRILFWAELIEDNARLTAEHAQLVAANQALATENARLVKRDQEARRIIEDADLCGGDIDRPAARAFLAGEGKP